MAKKKDGVFVYSENLKTIPQVIEWAEKQDVERFSRFFVEQPNIPLYCFSSGGASSTLHYAALLYETNRGMAKALTGLSISSISDDALKSSKILIFSKSGNGVDTKNLVDRAIAINPKGVGGLSRDNGKDNYLIETLKKVTTNWFQYKIPTLKGSFISSTSNIAAMCLVYEAFTGDFDIASKLKVDVSPNNSFSYIKKVGDKIDINRLSVKKNYIALYSGWGEPSARDFECKMVESGIASVQLCDFRNFCHGRFIFMSNHLEDSVFVLFLTPREREFTRNLIFNGTTFDRKDELFPQTTEIITLETEHDSPLATIDLVIKESVLVAEIGKVVGIDPYSPPNPHGIDKRVAIHEKYTGIMKQPLKNYVIQGRNGDVKSVSRKKAINYDPKKSIEKLAKDNGVSEATIRGYIKEHRIDRLTDEKMLMYNRIWLRYIKDSDQPIASIAKKLNLSENTVKQYLTRNYPQFDAVDGKITTVAENETLVKLREQLDASPRRFERVKKIQERHPEYDLDTILEKLPLSKKEDNVYQVRCFMQMDFFDADIKKGHFRYKNGKIIYIVNR